MSRIGKKAVAIPSGVTASVEGQTVKMKGPKGALQFVVPDEIAVTMEKGSIKVDPRFETKRALAMWGTSRTLVANLVAGVTKGFESKLDITGAILAGEVEQRPRVRLHPLAQQVSEIAAVPVGAMDIREARPLRDSRRVPADRESRK